MSKYDKKSNIKKTSGNIKIFKNMTLFYIVNSKLKHHLVVSEITDTVRNENILIQIIYCHFYLNSALHLTYR